MRHARSGRGALLLPGGVVVLAAAGALLWARIGTSSAADSSQVTTSITFSGHAGFRVEPGRYPDAAFEARVLDLVAPMLQARGLQPRGAGPARDDEISVRVEAGAGAESGVRFNFPASGEMFAVQWVGTRGVLWTGVFPVEESGLDARLREVLEPLRSEPPREP